MMRIVSTCKYMLPCGLCELKKELCSMTFNRGLTVTTVPLTDKSLSPETDPFIYKPVITCDSSAQENKDITV